MGAPERLRKWRQPHPLPASIAAGACVAQYCVDLSRSQAYYTLRLVRASHWRPWKEATDRPRRPRGAHEKGARTCHSPNMHERKHAFDAKDSGQARGGATTSTATAGAPAVARARRGASCTVGTPARAAVRSDGGDQELPLGHYPLCRRARRTGRSVRLVTAPGAVGATQAEVLTRRDTSDL